MAVSDGVPKSIHPDNAIFKLTQITKELKARTIIANLKSWESIEKHFLNNGVMISNHKAIRLLNKEAGRQDFKNAKLINYNG